MKPVLILFCLLRLVYGDEDFKSNLRSSLTDTHIQGHMMFELLDDHKADWIMKSVKRLMGDEAPAANRLKITFDEAMRCGREPISSPGRNQIIWREVRASVANHNLLEYRKNPTILDRIIAIDETPIMQGKLELIAAVVRYRFIATMFLTEGTAKAHSSTITTFVTEVLAPEVRRRGIVEPIIIWDNIGVHKSKETMDFFANNKWVVWPHPVHSPDMNPLDYADFKVLKSTYKGRWPSDETDLKAVETVVKTTIRELDGKLQGVLGLPDVWEALSLSDGLYTKKSCLTAGGKC